MPHYTSAEELRLIEQLEKNQITALDLGVFQPQCKQPKLLKLLEDLTVGRITCVAILPNGYIATGSREKTRKVWDPDTGACLKTFGLSWPALIEDDVLCLAVSSEGHLISGGGLDRTLRVFETEKGTCIQTLEGYSKYWFTCVAILPDGRVAGGSILETTVKIWEIGTGRCVMTLRGLKDGVTCIAAMPDGHIVSGDQGSTLRIWDPQTGKCLRILYHEGVSRVVVLSKFHIVSAGGDNTLRIWNVQTGQCLSSFTEHEASNICLFLLSDGCILSGSSDNIFKIWDSNTLECISTFVMPKGNPVSAVLPDDRLIIGGEGKGLEIWEIPARRVTAKRARRLFQALREAAPASQLKTLSLQGVELGDVGIEWIFELIKSHPCLTQLNVKDTGLTLNQEQALHDAIALRPLAGTSIELLGTTLSLQPCYALEVENQLILQLKNNQREILDLSLFQPQSERPKCLLKFPLYDENLSNITFLPNGCMVASLHNTLHLLDERTGHCLRVFEGHDGPVTCVSILSADRIVSGSTDHTLKIWNTKTGHCLQTITGHTGPVGYLAVLSDEKVISAGADQCLKIWDLARSSGQLLQELTGYTWTISCLAMLPNGHIVIGSHDKTLRIWDPAEMDLKTLTGHASAISCIAVSPGYIASGSLDGSIRFWDNARSLCLHTLQGHTGSLKNMSMSALADGHFVSAASDHTLKIWDPETGKCLYTFTSSSNTSIAVLPHGHITIVSENTLEICEVPALCLTAGHIQRLFQTLLETIATGTLKKLILRGVELGLYGFECLQKLIQSHHHLDLIDIKDTGLTPCQHGVLYNTVVLREQQTGHHIKLDGLSISAMGAPLHRHAQLGDLTELMALISSDWGLLEYRDEKGHTSLLLAAMFGHLKILKELLQRGANLKAKNNLGKTAQQLAPQGSEVAAFLQQYEQLYLTDETGNTFLHQACRQCNVNRAKELLNQGASVHIKNNRGDTALHTLLLSIQKLPQDPQQVQLKAVVDIARLLIKQGADLNVTHHANQTPLDLAKNIVSSKLTEEIAILLLKHRTKFPPGWLLEQFNNAVDKYIGEFESAEVDQKLLDSIVSSLTGYPVADLKKKERWVYIGHLHSLSGKFVVGETLDQANSYSTFESFMTDKALIFRVRSLFEMALSIHKDLTAKELLPRPKEEVLRHLYEELLFTLETLRAYQEQDFIMSQFQKLTHKRNISKLYNAHAENLTGKVRCLKQEETYGYPTGWKGHAIYLNIQRRQIKDQDHLVFRIDNLGEGVLSNQHYFDVKKSKTGIQRRYFYPSAFSTLCDNLADGSLENYFKAVVKAKIGKKDVSFDVIYNLHNQLPHSDVFTTEKIKEYYPARRKQTVGNCTVKNWHVGQQIRWQIGLPNDPNSHQLYRWFRQEEAHYLHIKYRAVDKLQLLYNSHRSNHRKSGVAENFQSQGTQELQTIIESAIQERQNTVGIPSSLMIIQEAAENWPPLLHAVIQGDLGEIQHCSQGNKFASAATENGYNALHLAVLSHHIDIVKYLAQYEILRHGRTSNQGETPLSLAVKLNQQELIKLLLQQEPRNYSHDLLASHTFKSYRYKVALEKPLEEAKPQLSNTFLLSDGVVIQHNEIDWTQKKLLGRGGCGIVYLAHWHGTKVAVKQLYEELSQMALEEFEKEAKIGAELRFKHVVQLYGITPKAPYYMVMEYMPKGSLYDLLRTGPLVWENKIKLALNISIGLSFLHTKNIIHRDLKSQNILIGKNNEVKLSDFGLSKIKQSTRSASKKGEDRGVGTLHWKAPELFKMGAQHTPKSDIYSLGMVLWEIASGRLPYEEAKDEVQIISHVCLGQREEIPSQTPSFLKKLITQCWDQSPEERPVLQEIISILAEGLKQLKSASYGGNNSNILLLSSPSEKRKNEVSQEQFPKCNSSPPPQKRY